MNIAALRVRILIQKNSTATDNTGNHRSEWEDFFRCWGTPMTERTDESEAAAHTVSADRLTLTVRWSSETAAVNPREYRVIINGAIYNITGIDETGFRHRSRKLYLEKKER